MISRSINILDNATPSVEAAVRDLSPRAVAERISEPLRIFWRDRLKSLGKNKRGWPSTGFWEDAARKTTSFVQDNGLLLVCDKQGVRQRWKGGPIKPVKAGALAIPISPVSYGHRPSEFPGLFLMRTKNGAYLVQAQPLFETPGRARRSARAASAFKSLGGHASRRLRAGLNFLFKLSPGVNQFPDERVVPSEEEMLAVAFAALARDKAAGGAN